MVRGEDDALRVFHNVCRHRGSRICIQDGGRVVRFQCPYHAWTYELDGTLRRAGHTEALRASTSASRALSQPAWTPGKASSS